MDNLYYKTKKFSFFPPFMSTTIVKNEGEIYTSFSIINNSDNDIKVIEKDTINVDLSRGTILGSKQMLTYENPPKNAVYINALAFNVQTDILIKYSE